ncbi:MAG: flagellar export chaperone FliS [Spirochaetales bacterium]|nr:flagellar export chaperone FliS [Spirochaetales bacterium]
MSNINPLNAYRETNIKTASQGKLIIMLYDGAVRNMETAVSGLSSENPKFDKVNNAILKAQDIITELMVSLDFERGGEIANNLYNLYIFFNKELMQANVQKDKEMITPVIKMMKDLRSAWIQVFNKTSAGANRMSAGVNVAG